MNETIPESENVMHSQPQEKKRKNIILFAIIISVLILIVILLIFLIQRQVFVKSRSYTLNYQVETPVSSDIADIGNSFAFASPLKATKGGEYIRITVYVLDDQGLGVPGKLVDLGNYPGLSIVKSGEYTDQTGMVYFDITADLAGLYLIQPSSGGQDLGQRVSITFEE